MLSELVVAGVFGLLGELEDVSEGLDFPEGLHLVDALLPAAGVGHVAQRVVVRVRVEAAAEGQALCSMFF